MLERAKVAGHQLRSTDYRNLCSTKRNFARQKMHAPWSIGEDERARAVDAGHRSLDAHAVGKQEPDRLALIRMPALPFDGEWREPVLTVGRERAGEFGGKPCKQTIAVDRRRAASRNRSQVADRLRDVPL